MGSHILRNSEPWHLNTKEIAYNIEDGNGHTHCGDPKSHTWKIYVPKIMPLIPMGTAKDSRVIIDSSILINARTCRPTINRIISSHNYILADKPGSVGFGGKYKDQGMEIEIEVLHDNVDNLRITNVYDNTHFHPWEDEL